MRAIRGEEIAMIFQEPMTSLNPLYTIGNQIEEGIQLHQTDDKAEASGGRSTSSTGWACRTRSGSTARIRMSCPAVCVSAP